MKQVLYGRRGPISIAFKVVGFFSFMWLTFCHIRTGTRDKSRSVYVAWFTVSLREGKSRSRKKNRKAVGRTVSGEHHGPALLRCIAAPAWRVCIHRVSLCTDTSSYLHDGYRHALQPEPIPITSRS